MCGCVVEDQVYVEIIGDFGVELFEEGQELGGPVARMQGADHFAGGEVEGGIQARGAVADVVVAGTRGRAGQHREHWLGPVKGLDLGFLVHTQHQRPLRRVQIQPHDIADLGHEQRILG